MKKISMAACLVASLGICSHAMAKDIDGVDVFAGNSLTAIASLDVASVAKNQVVYDVISALGGDRELQMMAAGLAKYGIDYKKDISSIVFVLDLSQHPCLLFDATRSVKNDWAKIVAEQGENTEKYGKYDVVTISDARGVLLSDKRVLFCEANFDTHAVLDNVAKPKTLKSADSVLYTAYSQTSAKADFRAAAKMSAPLRRELAGAELRDGDVVVSVTDAEAFSLSVDLKKGASIDARALGKSDKMASDAAAIINKQVSPLLSDPSLKEMGLGFLSSVVKIASSKKYLTLNVNLSKDQVKQILDIMKANVR